jgi:hypothetical protein
MGWLRARFGESNTAIGAGLLYMVLSAKFPQHRDVIDTVSGVLGVGFVITPKS